MLRSLSTGLRFALRVVFRSRLLRWIFLVYLCFWAFDRLVEVSTDAAWFASVGHGSLFWHQVGIRALLFWGFSLPALALAIGTMRVVAHPGGFLAETPPLPHALRRWERWQARVLKLSWLFLALTIWVLGRNLADYWVEALQFRYGGAWDAAPWKLHAGFWVFQLPFLSVLLHTLWLYGLLLFAVAALAGGVRSLPFLAARHVVVPSKWETLLLRLGAGLLVLRALGYVLDALRIPSGGLLRVGDASVAGLLCVLGGGLCLWALLGLRQSKKRSRLVARVGAALFLPLVLGFVLWPLRSLGNGITSASLEHLNEEATRGAWNLKAPAPLDVAGPKTPRIERFWPLWDERFLLMATRGRAFDANGHVIDWRLAGQRVVDGKLVGVVAGVPASSQLWSARLDADKDSANVYQGFDLQGVSANAPPPLQGLAEHKATQTLTEHFYGMKGPTLFGDGKSVLRHGMAGLAFQSVWMKLAWAWRLRNPVLLLEGAGAKRLLVFRDIRESAQKLAPMFLWDAPRPGPNEWTLEGYGVTNDFPGSPAPPAGPLQGWNAVRPASVLHLDPATGALALRTMGNNPFVATWRRALPELWTQEDGEPDESRSAPFLALEEATVMVEAPLEISTALRGLDERFWSVRQGEVALIRRSRVPREALDRLKLLDARAHGKEPERLEKGVPALWPDRRAPGGYWIARPYFSVLETRGLGERVESVRVLLTALSRTAPLVEGDTAEEAVYEFKRESGSEADTSLLVPEGKTSTVKVSPVPTPPLSDASLEAQLLRIHEEVKKQAAASRWKEFGKALKREDALLQELARRRQPTPSPTQTSAASPLNTAPVAPSPTPRK